MQLRSDVDFEELAKKTSGFTGADLQAVLYTSQLTALEERERDLQTLKGKLIKIMYWQRYRFQYVYILAVQKVLSGSGSAGRLRFLGKYIGHRLLARPEPDNTFWTAKRYNAFLGLLSRSCNT